MCFWNAPKTNSLSSCTTRIAFTNMVNLTSGGFVNVHYFGNYLHKNHWKSTTNFTFNLHICREHWYLEVFSSWLTHWGRVTHMGVSKLNVIGSDNGLSPARRQAIFRTNAGILLIRPLGTKISEIFIEVYTFSFKKCIWKCRLENDGHFTSVRRLTLLIYHEIHIFLKWSKLLKETIFIPLVKKSGW